MHWLQRVLPWVLQLYKETTSVQLHVKPIELSTEVQVPSFKQGLGSQRSPVEEKLTLKKSGNLGATVGARSMMGSFGDAREFVFKACTPYNPITKRAPAIFLKESRRESDLWKFVPCWLGIGSCFSVEVLWSYGARGKFEEYERKEVGC